MRYLILTLMACTYTLNGYCDEALSTPWVFLTKPAPSEETKCERPKKEKGNENDTKPRKKKGPREPVKFRENPREKLGR